MEQNVIKFQGGNSDLFTRVPVAQIDAKLSVIVPETHNAILIKDGQMLQTLSSGKYLLCKFIDLKTEVDSAIEILYLSKTAKLKLLWGTAQKLLMFDEAKGINYHLGLSGDFEVQVGDPRKCYLYLVGASADLTAADLQERLQSNVTGVVETEVVEYLHENKVPYSQISVHKRQMSARVLKNLSHKLLSEYGIAVFSFNIANIIIDEEDLKKLSTAQIENDSAKFCANCGASLKQGDKFCSQCGNKV